jgi:hypothetical protein
MTIDIEAARVLCSRPVTFDHHSETAAEHQVRIIAMARTLPAALYEIERLRAVERRRNELSECCSCRQAAADASEDNIRLRAALNEACDMVPKSKHSVDERIAELRKLAASVIPATISCQQDREETEHACDDRQPPVREEHAMTDEELQQARALLEPTGERVSATHLIALRVKLRMALDEVDRLRATRDHSCACSVNDGAAPLVKHDKDCPIRVNLRRRISPELALQRLGAALDSSDEVEELLAERDALRTDLCNLLARAHRDGGHYIDEHGLSKAVKDADERIAEAYAERDVLIAEVEPLRRVHKVAQAVERAWTAGHDTVSGDLRKALCALTEVVGTSL